MQASCKPLEISLPVLHTEWPLNNGPPSDELVQYAGYFDFPALFGGEKLKHTGKTKLSLTI